MTTEPQESAEATRDLVAKIEKRVAHMEYMASWILALMILSAIAGLIIGIVIAVGVHDAAVPASPF